MPRATLDRSEVRRMARARSFTGFRPDAIQFLVDLAATTSARGSSRARPNTSAC